MRPLTELLGALTIPFTTQGSLPENVTGITADSRQVQPGFIFAAIPGVKAHGNEFIASAITSGSAVILCDDNAVLPADHPAIRVGNTRLATAKIAAAYYQKQPQHIIAVTGTNGKSSTTDFVRQMHGLLGKKAACLGTMGLITGDWQLPQQFPALNTSPDPILLAQILAALVDAGCEHLAIEASSHGLDQFRLDGAQLEAAAFTNLTHDHLDYHASMDAYFEAKARLFTDMPLRSNHVVIHKDDPYGAQLIERSKQMGRKVISYGKSNADITLKEVTATTSGLQIHCSIYNQEWQGAIPIFGLFQAENIAAAMGLLVAQGFGPKEIFPLLPQLTGVRGRMEWVGQTKSGAQIFVDYAHTPDALQTILENLRHHTAKQLHLVFGCGGDRDKSKRPKMGHVAAQYADQIIVTDDNPRTEDPSMIRNAIIAAAPQAKEIADRRDAIAHAVLSLQEGDVLVVAGKGHETYQIIGERSTAFDDAEIIREVIRSYEEYAMEQ